MNWIRDWIPLQYVAHSFVKLHRLAVRSSSHVEEDEKVHDGALFHLELIHFSTKASFGSLIPGGRVVCDQTAYPWLHTSTSKPDGSIELVEARTYDFRSMADVVKECSSHQCLLILLPKDRASFLGLLAHLEHVMPPVARPPQHLLGGSLRPGHGSATPRSIT